MTLTLYTSGYNYSTRRCESIVSWFVSKYLKRYKIEISVHHRGLLREGVVGWCSITDYDLKPRSFEIEIHNRLNKEDYIKTLMHEMVHLMDFCKGNLLIKSGKRYYNGIDIEDLEYENQPHEIYAHQKEEELYSDYMEYLNN